MPYLFVGLQVYQLFAGMAYLFYYYLFLRAIKKIWYAVLLQT